MHWCKILTVSVVGNVGRLTAYRQSEEITRRMVRHTQNIDADCERRLISTTPTVWSSTHTQRILFQYSAARILNQ
jgi:hypothetical protein